MHDLTHLGPRKILIFGDGSFYVTETVVWAWIVGGLMIAFALWSTRNMKMVPDGKQVIAEKIVDFFYSLVNDIMGKKHGDKFAPYFGFLFCFLLLCNLLGLFGFRQPTTDLNCTFACSLLTFALVQINGVRSMGFVGKLKHMASPMKFMFPIKLIEECVLPVSLGCRIFGNILGGMILMALIYTGLESVSHMFCSIPILVAIIPLPANAFFDMFEPVLQAYVFTMISMVMISNEMVGDESH